MVVSDVVLSLRKSGARVVFNSLPARIYPVGNDEVALKFDSESIPQMPLTNYQLEQAYGKELHFLKDKILLPNHTFVVSAKTTTETFRQQTYLQALYELAGKRDVIGGKKLREKAVALGAKRLNDQRPPSISALAIWAQDERDINGGIKAKLSQQQKHKRKSKFSDALQYDLISYADEKFFGKSVSIVAFYKLFVNTYKGIYKEFPCYEAVRQWLLNVIDPSIKLKGKKRSEVRNILRNATKKFITDRPLQRVEADGASLRLGLIDEEGNYLGQPTAIFILDVHTRSVLGYEVHIGKGEPASSVISAYRHAICPKPAGSFYTQYEKTWFSFGIPELLVCDGGSGFISKETHIYVAKTSGTTIETVPSYSPWLKPFVERFIYTFRLQCERGLAGYVGKVEDHATLEHKIKERASLTIDELRRIIDAWIVDEYHQSPHSGLNYKTPYQVWSDAIEHKGFYPEVPADMYKVNLPMGKRKKATILGDDCHLGVQVNRIKYNDLKDKLKLIGQTLKANNDEAQVECLYDDNDVYSITVVDPFTGEELEIETTDHRVSPGMSLIEFYVKYPSSYSQKGYNHPSTIFTHPDAIRGKEIEEKATKKKKVTRKNRIEVNDYQKGLDNFEIDAEPTDIDPYQHAELGDVAPLPQS